MTLKFRRYLYITFIIIFLIATPLVSLYAMGYKIGTGFKIQKTGILAIDTKPISAKIFIDNKVQQNFFKKIFTTQPSFITTPAKIKNLLPGEYDVRIELEGYWPWQKKLKIESGQSTYAEDIVLFRNNLPIQLFTDPMNNLVFSYDKNYLAGFNQENLAIYNIKTESREIIASAQNLKIDLEESTSINWSFRNDKVLVGPIIYDVKDYAGLINLNKNIGGLIKNIKWDTFNSKTIFYESYRNLNYYDIDSQKSGIITSNVDLEDYLPKNENIYLIKKDNNSANLEVWDRDEEKIIRKINLPKSEYRFINAQNDLLNIMDTRHDILYLINPFEPLRPIRETINNIKLTNWVNNQKLLYANELEIWIYNLNSGSKKLLTRLSEPITNILWHPNDNNIIFSTNKYINVLELDDREKYNVTRLIELDQIQNLNINKDGDTLYFHAHIGAKEGFYKLIIQ